jgi:hypothetical protein
LKILVKIGRFFLVAAALAMVMPIYFLILLALDGESPPFELYMLAFGITFPLACTGGLVFGLPAWTLAKNMNWHEDIWKVLGLGAIAGILSVSLLFLFSTPDLFSLVMGPLLGLPAGLLSAALWYLLHADDRQQIEND